MLSDSVSTIARKMLEMHSPAKLQLLWPFFGLDVDELQAVVNELAVVTTEAGGMLCSQPNDPCQFLCMVVKGSLQVSRIQC